MVECNGCTLYEGALRGTSSGGIPKKQEIEVHHRSCTAFERLARDIPNGVASGLTPP